ncbi:hypothetical protein KEJ34_03140 [Candidatus Bathyarchaeota archaeon]|nr:hypothetical protein [Candidatus Bathyarchaeota archaeon]
MVSLRKGSRSVGAVAIVYGVLATLAGLAFTAISIMSMRPTEEAHIAIMARLLPASVAVLAIGIIIILLGYKTFKAAKTKEEKTKRWATIVIRPLSPVIDPPHAHTKKEGAAAQTGN